jgi:hypothetical protein
MGKFYSGIGRKCYPDTLYALINVFFFQLKKRKLSVNRKGVIIHIYFFYLLLLSEKVCRVMFSKFFLKMLQLYCSQFQLTDRIRLHKLFSL